MDSKPFLISFEILRRKNKVTTSNINKIKLISISLKHNIKMNDKNSKKQQLNL